MDKRDIELMRLKTQMAEMYRQAQPPYLQSQQQAAKEVLTKLQENYKALSGEYCEHFIIKESGTITIGNNISEDLKKFLTDVIIPKSKGYVKDERDAAALLFDIIKHRYNF